MIPPGLEPGTFRVLGERDNHYTTESTGRGLRFIDYILALHLLVSTMKNQ